MEYTTIEQVAEMNSFDHGVVLHRNLESQEEVAEEIKRLHKHTSVYNDGCGIIINLVIPPCHHEHDCCGCHCGTRYTVHELYTEEAWNINL